MRLHHQLLQHDASAVHNWPSQKSPEAASSSLPNGQTHTSGDRFYATQKARENPRKDSRGKFTVNMFLWLEFVKSTFKGQYRKYVDNLKSILTV